MKLLKSINLYFDDVKVTGVLSDHLIENYLKYC